MLENLRAAFLVPDIRKRILFVFGAFALFVFMIHVQLPGVNEKRWQDVEELLEAGIDVITTVNIQHLESVNDVVEKITGIVQRETVPDAIVRKAEQIELVDITQMPSTRIAVVDSVIW